MSGECQKGYEGYKVEYSEDMNEVCVIPIPSICSDEFHWLTLIFMKKGYKTWLPADDRKGYLYCKDADLYYKKYPQFNVKPTKETEDVLHA